MARLPDGLLLVSFQTDEDVAYRQGNPSSDPAAQSYDYTHHTSFKYVMGGGADAAGGWSAPVKLAGSPSDPSVWNALYVTRSGRVLALAGFHWRSWCKIGTVGK